MTDLAGMLPLEPPLCDDRMIWDLWLSAYHFPALTAADEVGLFSFLATSPATAQVVANHLSLSNRGSEALLAVLAALGFLAQAQGRFSLTEVSRAYLLPDSDYYYGGLLRGDDSRPAIHDALREALKSDAPWEAPGHGDLTDAWAAGELTPEQAEEVTAFMHSHSFPAAMGMARRGDFAGVQRLLDVAGGSGCFSIALAWRNPDLSCTVLELPAVCTVAQRTITQYRLDDRIGTLAANMFIDPWPSGHDAVFFSNIFHDWDRPTCLQLAHRSYAALPPGGRIYLQEMLLDDTKTGPLAAATFSLVMLLDTRGQQFTAGELAELLQEAGFVDVSTVPTYTYYSLVSAMKPA